MIRLTCPCCGARLNANESLLGQTVKCPKCVGPVFVKRDIVKPVEPNYETRPIEDDTPQPTKCPSCTHLIPAGVSLCSKCGFHLKLEAKFENLTDAEIAKGREPKTREEAWLAENAHELSTPRDILVSTGLFVGFLSLASIVIGRIALGEVVGEIVGIMASACYWFAWWVLMRRFGLLQDPNREKRLEQQGRKKKNDSRWNYDEEPETKEAPIDPRLAESDDLESDLANFKSKHRRKKKTPDKTESPQTPHSSEQATQTLETPKPEPKTDTRKKPEDDDWLNDLL